MLTCVLGKGPRVYRTYGTTVCQVDKTANRLCRAFVPQHAYVSPHARIVTLYPESIRQLERIVNRLLLRDHVEMNRKADERKPGTLNAVTSTPNKTTGRRSKRGKAGRFVSCIGQLSEHVYKSHTTTVSEPHTPFDSAVSW